MATATAGTAIAATMMGSNDLMTVAIPEPLEPRCLRRLLRGIVRPAGDCPVSVVCCPSTSLLNTMMSRSNAQPSAQKVRVLLLLLRVTYVFLEYQDIIQKTQYR